MNDQEINLDFERENRTGLAEAVFCKGKSAAQLDSICQKIREEHKPMLFTKLSEDQFSLVDSTHPGLLEYDPVSQTAFRQPAGMKEGEPVAVVTGGSSDVPVARETSRTLAYYGYRCLEIDDAGVAGLWRITSRLEQPERKAGGYLHRRHGCRTTHRTRRIDSIGHHCRTDFCGLWHGQGWRNRTALSAGQLRPWHYRGQHRQRLWRRLRCNTGA